MYSIRHGAQILLFRSPVGWVLLMARTITRSRGENNTVGLYGFGLWAYDGYIHSAEVFYSIMDSSGKFSATTATVRVVVLSRQQALASLALAGSGASRMQIIRVESPYQGAAEILAEPTEAMVVDFRLLSIQHLRLIKIARELGVAVLAVGALPVNISSDELSGVQLVGRGDLADALSRIASEASSTGTAPARPVKLTPAKLPSQAAIEPDQPSEDQSFFGKANRPSNLLTSEELASLLEDMP